MTIAELDGALKEIVNNHHVYGAECIINALARACKGHDYLEREDIQRMLDSAIRREEQHEF